MSIFGSIMGAIFGHGSAQASASPTSAPSAPPAQTVDVAAIVDKAAAAKGEKLAWRTSIVDLMKALNLDSSLNARKQLASFIKGAKKQLIIYDPKVSDPSMIRLLEERSKTGVDVKIIGRLTRKSA